MVVKFKNSALVFIVILMGLLALSGCKTAPKQAAATSTMSSDNALAGGTEYGICVIKIEEQVVKANPIFLSMNKKLKCSNLERCYHLVLEGTCDPLDTPVLYVEALERNVENFSSTPEKNGSFKYSKDAACVDGTFKLSAWLQLKGTDSFEVKTKHFANLKAFKEDQGDYVMMNTSLFQPEFDAATGEVKGFTDRSSTYNSKLTQCRRKFPSRYMKQAL